MSIFVDSWAWLGILDDDDCDHEAALEAVERAVHDRIQLVTSDYVLAETATLLCRRLAARGQSAVEPLMRMVQMQGQSGVQVEHVSPIRFSRALDLRFLYHDKLSISFTDLTTMVVMEDLSIKEIVTRDSHFLKVNRGFRLIPGARQR